MTTLIFCVLLFGTVPIAVVLALSAVVYIAESDNFILFDSFAQQMFSGLENYGLLAIPLFMLTGELMNAGGITERLIKVARVFVGGFRGGLAWINIVSNMFMAAIIGSAVSQIAIMSRAMVPAMAEEGYDPGFAAATTAAGGLLAPVIPPSMLFIIYGVLAQIPIGDMFLAGIIPGLMMFLGFIAVITVLGWISPFPRRDWMSAKESVKALIESLPAALIPACIILAILFGVATPTESAAIASVIAFLLGKFVYRDLKVSDLGTVFVRTARNSALVIFMIATANVFGWVIIYEAIPQKLAALITVITTDPFVFLLIVNGVLLLVGMLIDGIAAIILVTPILLPIAMGSYGISPYQFGVVISINLILGLLTPPVGVGLYIASAMSEVKPVQIFKALWPFLLATLIVLLLLSRFPDLSTALI
ncbi:MAG: TRAP transporter large permease [Gammaproteobacteria bacterium]|nr:TRAP transporter large permease [Gammaproteobacteria bacterium]MCY4274533.1 TRAP transporter large permease [Gammaproteobacteria bacterium]